MRGGAGSAVRLTPEDAQLLRDLPEIQHVAESVGTRLQVIYGSQNWNTSVEGTNVDLPAIRSWGLKYGSFFTEEDVKSAAKVVVLGSNVADNLFGEGVLFGRNWGAIDYVPFLHFETCYYQAIDFAIARGLRRVEAGAQGEHKLLRGYLPVETHSAHLIAHKGLSRAVDDFLAREREAMAENMADLARHAPFRKT